MAATEPGHKRPAHRFSRVQQSRLPKLIEKYRSEIERLDRQLDLTT